MDITNLREFILKAEKSRKYQPAKAEGMRVALAKYESVLTEEEKGSTEVFNERFEAITGEVFRRFSTIATASSLDTYRKRVKLLINDFHKYDNDPQAFTNWKPLMRSFERSKNKKSTETNQNNSQVELIEEKLSPGSTFLTYEKPMEKFDAIIDKNRQSILLPRNRVAIIEHPLVIDEIDIEAIQKYIDYLKLSIS